MEEESCSPHRSQEAENKNPLQRHAPKDTSSNKVTPPQVSSASQQPLCFEAIQIKHS